LLIPVAVRVFVQRGDKPLHHSRLTPSRRSAASKKCQISVQNFCDLHSRNKYR